jgi:hypothetical protein
MSAKILAESFWSAARRRPVLSQRCSFDLGLCRWGNPARVQRSLWPSPQLPVHSRGLKLSPRELTRGRSASACHACPPVADEARERFTVGSGDASIARRVPSNWLCPGLHLLPHILRDDRLAGDGCFQLSKSCPCCERMPLAGGSASPWGSLGAHLDLRYRLVAIGEARRVRRARDNSGHRCCNAGSLHPSDWSWLSTICADLSRPQSRLIDHHVSRRLLIDADAFKVCQSPL